MANLCIEIDRRKDGSSVHPDVMKDISTERGDKGKGMIVKVRDAGDVTKEVPVNEFFLWDPKLFSTIIDDRVLVGVTVNNKGTSRGSKCRDLLLFMASSGRRLGI